MRRYAVWQFQETGEPIVISLGVIFHLCPIFDASDDRAGRDDKNIVQFMSHFTLHPWIGYIFEYAQHKLMSRIVHDGLLSLRAFVKFSQGLALKKGV